MISKMSCSFVNSCIYIFLSLLLLSMAFAIRSNIYRLFLLYCIYLDKDHFSFSNWVKQKIMLFSVLFANVWVKNLVLETKFNHITYKNAYFSSCFYFSKHIYFFCIFILTNIFNTQVSVFTTGISNFLDLIILFTVYIWWFLASILLIFI